MDEDVVSEAPVDNETLVSDAPVDNEEVVTEVAELSEIDSSEVEVAPEAEVPVDPFAEYGGLESVQAAAKLYEASRTEQGVVQLFLEAGRSLGLGLKEMEALFGKAPAAETEPEEEDDPDRLLTVRELREWEAKQRETAEKAQREQTHAAAQRTVTETLQSLGLSPTDQAAKIVLQFGDQYVKAADLANPEAVANAVRRGHADFQAALETEAKKYVASKAAVKKAVPKAPGGSAAPTPPPAEEPTDVAEASRRVRKMLGIN